METLFLLLQCGGGLGPSSSLFPPSREWHVHPHGPAGHCARPFLGPGLLTSLFRPSCWARNPDAPHGGSTLSRHPGTYREPEHILHKQGPCFRLQARALSGSGLQSQILGPLRIISILKTSNLYSYFSTDYNKEPNSLCFFMSTVGKAEAVWSNNRLPLGSLGFELTLGSLQLAFP